MKTLLSIIMLGAAAATFGQEAMEAAVDIDTTYFHPAASMYIQGNASGASNLVHQGLAEFPDNGKLLRLKELLDQQQEQQQNQDQNNDQQNQDQNQQDQQDQEPNKDQQNQDQQNDQNQDQNQDQKNQNEQDPQDQQNQDQQQQQAEPPRAEEMSRDEAERLMDAMKQDEETKRLMLQPVRGAPVKVDKDW